MNIPIQSSKHKTLLDSSQSTKPEQEYSNRQSTTQPKIIVFDRFDKDSAIFDYNNDGIRDRSHGQVVSDIIESQTGYSAQQVDGSEDNITATFEELLKSEDLTGTYVNLSIDWARSPKLENLFLQVANKGAKIYIAAGNEYINGAANKVLGQHKNIFIVASSDGIIGEAEQTQPTKQNISNPATDRVANGVLKPITSQDGIDINRDGKIDFPNSILRNPYPDLTSKFVKETYANSLLSSMNADIKDLYHPIYLLGREDIQGKVLSIKDLRRFGFISEFLDKSLKENFQVIDESQTYIDLVPFSIYIWHNGNKGDIVLYKNEQNSLAKLLPSYKPIPATSWAAPNALAEDVIKDFGCH